MRRFPAAVLLLATLSALPACGVAPSTAGARLAAGPVAAAASGKELLVKLKPGRQAPARAGLKVKRAIAKLGWYVAEAADPAADPAAALAALRQDPAVAAAERHGLVSLPKAPARLSLPGFSLQAALDDPMLPNREKTHARIQLEKAWAVAGRRGAGVTVAVLDTGIDAAHPDLVNRLVPGYDTVHGDADPADDHSHGTACAGIVAAEPGNGIGTAGMAPEARVMPIKCLDTKGVGPLEWAAAGIVWATDHGARVITMSFGEDERSQLLQDAVDYARRKNVVCIAAMGNDGEEVSHWPARTDGVLAVGATYDDDRPTLFTTEGAWVGLAAPGTRVHTTFPTYPIVDPMYGKRDLNYTWFSGTSAASPIVAAVAALMIAEAPAITEAEVRRRLRATADDVGAPGWDKQSGDGRVNAFRALTERP